MQQGSWAKAPAELAERFQRTVAGMPGSTVRKMFGHPAGFTDGGHMFTGVHEDRWIVRLPEAARAELAGAGGQPFEPMPGRPMKEYLALPAAVLADDDALAHWLDRALAYASGLPPKKGR